MFLSHIKESIAIDFAQQCEIVLDSIFAQVNMVNINGMFSWLFHHVILTYAIIYFAP